MEGILLWLFVVDLGLACGAGLYEQRIVVSRWRPIDAGGDRRWDGAAARADDSGRRFWVAVTTVPLTLLAVANAAAAWQGAGALRVWWLAAAGAALAERALTFGYFIPAMVTLMRAGDSPQTRALAGRWSALNYVRHAAIGVAWLAAMEALTLM